MIRFICAIFFFAGSQSIYSQYKIDSLFAVWNDQTYSDSLRMNAIHLVGFHKYLSSNPDSAYICGSLEYELAIKNNLYRNAVGALTLQANSFLVKRDYMEAISYYNKGLNLALEKNQKDVTIAIYGNMGRLLVSIGLFDSAMICLNQALETAEFFKDNKGKTTILNSIGGIYRERGDLVSALDLYEQSLLIDLEMKNLRGLASDYGNIGNVYYAQSNYVKAEEFYKKALLYYEKTNDSRGTSIALSNLGGVYAILLKSDLALEMYQKGIDIKIKSGDQKGIALLLEGMSTVYYNKNEFVKSNELLDSAISIYQSTGELNNLVSAKIHLGKVLFKMDLVDEAINECTESYLISKEMKFENRTYQALDILIQLNCSKGNYHAADSFVNELIEFNRRRIEMNFPILTELEKEIYLNSISESQDLCKTYLMHTSVNKDLAIEREINNLIFTKGILLRSTSATRNSILASGDSTLIADYTGWVNLKMRIAKIYSEGGDAQSLESEADNLEKLIMKKSSVFNEIDRLKKMTWNDIQEGLKPHESFLDFVHFKEYDFVNKKFADHNVYYAFVINKTCSVPLFIRLFDESEISALLSNNPGNNLTYIKNLYGTTSEPSTKLYDLIWKNLESTLAGEKTIYLSLSGSLHKVSFGALFNGDQMLCDKYNLCYISSPERFITERKDKHLTDSFLLYGGINYGKDSSSSEVWSYLPGSLTEVEEIIKLKNKKDFISFTGENASETSFKNESKKYDVIHVATHGFFYPDPKDQLSSSVTDQNEDENIEFRGKPLGYKILVENNNPLMRSGLVFANANKIWSRNTSVKNEDSDDGVLTAMEVTDLNLSGTELVVLSACETGLGDIRGSEGVYGLQRAFKMAGARFLIMSLWQVPDKETAEFMITFYKNLFKTGDIQASFLKTQRLMKAKYDPYFWAAFVLIE